MRGALLLLVLAGCGGIAYEDYPDAIRDANCDYLVRCHAIASTADCRAYYDRFAIESPSLDAALDADKVAYDEDAAQRCIDAYGALSCDETLLADNALAACDDVLTGQLATGQPCGFDAECTSDHCSKPTCTMACCTGACADPIGYPAIGDPCTSLCEDGAFCGADAICHALLPAGAACDPTSLCDAKLYCAGLSAGGSGVCSPLPHEGEACESDCAERGSICIFEKCFAAGLAGDPCDVDGECAEFYTCTGAGTCGDYPALGMECTGRCSGDAYCESGLCVEQKPSGAACMYNDDCATHYCGDDDLCGYPPLCI
jgi:hypothetical protein